MVPRPPHDPPDAAPADDAPASGARAADDVPAPYAAFEGDALLGAGPLAELVAAVKAAHDRRRAPVLVFDPRGEVIELDLRGSLAQIRARLPAPPDATPADATPADGDGADAPRGRGRPRLGVIAREVTLLPHHWDYLAAQPGGASATLRRLVEAARKATAARDRVRHAREAVYRFAHAIAGDAPGFEEATRALFAGDRARFLRHTARWPADVRRHALTLGAAAFEDA